MKFNVIHNGRREKAISTQAQREVVYRGRRSKKHNALYGKQYQRTKLYENANNAVFGSAESWTNVDEKVQGLTAVSEGDLSVHESVELEANATAVRKNNGLQEQSFIRRTALKIRKGVERVAHRRRRFNYARKVADERVRENLWKRIRMEIDGRDQLKQNSLYDMIGCDWQQFKGHIELQFEEGMSWANYGDWYIGFLNDKVSQKWNYTNLKPIYSSKEN
jgi:hypothetical protein